MALRIRECPVAWEFPEPWEIPVTQEFPRLKLFPPVSRETGISREFPNHGFPLNIPALLVAGIKPAPDACVAMHHYITPALVQYHAMLLGMQ